MSDKIIYWASVIFSVLALLLMIANTALVNGNRSIQREMAERQTEINYAVNLVQLNQGLAQLLAEAAISKDDKSIKDLLASQGITLKQNDKSKNNK